MKKVFYLYRIFHLLKILLSKVTGLVTLLNRKPIYNQFTKGFNRSRRLQLNIRLDGGRALSLRVLHVQYQVSFAIGSQDLL
jgi:hypothetical protein